MSLFIQAYEWVVNSWPFVLQDIDVKRQGAVSAYAFVQYSDISSVVKALKGMEGEHMGSMKLKVRI